MLFEIALDGIPFIKNQVKHPNEDAKLQLPHKDRFLRSVEVSKSKHPVMINKMSELAKIQDEISDESDNARKKLRSELNIAKSRVARLQKDIKTHLISFLKH